MITMDFVLGFPKGRKRNDAIWVIVDRWTKFALFLSIKMTASVDKLAKIYIKRWYDSIGFQCSLYRIEILGSPLDFGRAYNMPWGQDWT
jgi:hypothetical protein